jgi:2-phospho-L-lactate guanylyltransferase
VRLSYGRMLPTAIVPVRIAPTAKRRLAHALGPADRMSLVRTLFEHVTDVLLDVGLSVVALSPTPIDAPVEVLLDEAVGLNAALNRALVVIGTPAIVVHADLPLVAPSDVEAVLASTSEVVVARARDGGTNALLLRRPMRVTFGPVSALAHARRARTAGLSTRVLDVPGLAWDVDDEVGLSLCRPRP